ncbi:MAG: hypothetical protein Q8O05_03255 [Chloroflexota bacterium]|nr:hypothetical protein [Chloroflexota bacterium]
MDEQQHHEELVKGITEQMKPVLEKSPQAIYVYLDDNHKVCNKKLTDLLGYESPKEWAETDAPLADVIEEDQPAVIKAYENATEKMLASSIEVRVKNIKTGKVVKTKMILVPIAYSGHLFAMHFLSKI